MLKKVLSFLLKFFVTAGLFTLLFRPETFGFPPDAFGNVSPKTMLEELRGAHTSGLVFWLALATLVKLTGVVAGIFRWRMLLRGQGLWIPAGILARWWFIGRYIGIFLPGTIGLDGYRLVESSRETGEVIKSATVIAVEKLIGFIALTFLVFVTLPFGLGLPNIAARLNVMVLGVMLLALAAFVVVSFLLLLNPRVIQILIALIPTPRILRDKVSRLGAAAASYEGKRLLLIKATALGVWVHLATCLMFFCTMMAVRTQGVSLTDILFASPIMIYGTVLGPSVGGEGIREIVFVTLLKGSASSASAALFSHLGWWCGEVVPAVIGAAYSLRTRPSKEAIRKGLADTRQELGQSAQAELAELTPAHVGAYRSSLLRTLFAGVGAGLIAGALVGLAEAIWVVQSLAASAELRALWWGPLVYGILFTGLGAGVAAALAFLYLLLDRFPSTARTYGAALGLSLAAAVVVIGFFRVKRDLLDMHGLGLVHYAALAGVALVVAVLAERIVAYLFRRSTLSFRSATVLTLGAYALVVASGAVASVTARSNPQQVAMAAGEAKASGPNIILVAVDTLRADYLPLYSPDAPVRTPRLEAFAKDGVLFPHSFAQAAWTKASFATIFSGLYPETHSATSKDRVLPLSVTTFPEALLDHGYYTQGFANNPNIMASVNFGQGFNEYVDLKPRLHFGASSSAASMSLYNVLRLVRIRVLSKFTKKIDVTDYYQPGEAVNEGVFRWLDSPQAPKDRPFFLFVHYMDPHDPYIDHETGVGYARAQMEHPDPEKMLAPMKKAYCDEIRYTDTSFGALVDGLKQRNLYDNSVIVFTSDHGEEFFDHDGWWHGQTLYDEQIHVPLIIKLPKNSQGGLLYPSFARHIDIAPTLLRLAGLEPVPAMQGRPLFQPDGAVDDTAVSFVFSQEDFEGNVLQSVRTRDAKLIRANEDNPRGLEPSEFYDVAQDPGERTNQSGQGDPREAELGGVLERMQPVLKDNAAAPELQQDLSDEEKAQLGNIGYL